MSFSVGRRRRRVVGGRMMLGLLARCVLDRKDADASVCFADLFASVTDFLSVIAAGLCASSGLNRIRPVRRSAYLLALVL